MRPKNAANPITVALDTPTDVKIMVTISNGGPFSLRHRTRRVISRRELTPHFQVKSIAAAILAHSLLAYLLQIRRRLRHHQMRGSHVTLAHCEGGALAELAAFA